ncbi:MAG: hypothetical protein AAGD47_09250 [Pseudomonadota bacterium]
MNVSSAESGITNSSSAPSTSGDAETALELLTQMQDGDPALASDLAWLAGDWRQAASAGPAARRLLATYMARDPSATATGFDERAEVFLPSSQPSAEITIKGSADVLERSKAVRAVIEEALSNG